MDFPNERYVRLYTRETTTWRLLGWQGQALLPQVLRIVDRSGVLDLSGQDMFSAVHAHLPGWPADVVGDGIVALVQRGIIVQREGQLVWPRFLEAQEAAMSDAQRQREARARRRDAAVGQQAQSVVYFIQAESGGPIKIGFASDLTSRLVGLQTSHSERLTCLLAIPGDCSLEDELHERFDAFRVRGEWFLPSDELLAFIADQSRNVTSRAVTPRHSSLALPAVPTEPSVPSLESAAYAAQAEPVEAPVGESAKARPVGAKAQRRHQLPDNFEPDGTRQRLAVELGVADLAVEVQKFREYHQSRGNTMANWQLALATWLRNAVAFEARRGRNPGNVAGARMSPVSAQRRGQPRNDLAEFMAEPEEVPK